MRETAEMVTNVQFSDQSWQQASLPARFGGLGIRSVESLALPCFLGSVTSALPLMEEIYPLRGQPPIIAQAVESFSEVTGSTTIPGDESAGSQRAWDEIACEQSLKQLLSSANQVDRARLLAASAPHSGAWLQAVPIPSLGLHMDSETTRIAVALRTGAPICQPHRCRCGGMVDRFGHHGLSCGFTSRRMPRHANLNDVVKRALATAGVPSWLEPVGLDRGDGRRPDGVTVFPYSGGRSLCWDGTCVDTFCRTWLIESALQPGSAASAAETRKRAKYRGLTDRYDFEPVAVETSGVMGPSTLRFLKSLGRRMKAVTGESREVEWLMQRFSIAIARGNSAAILASGQT